MVRTFRVRPNHGVFFDDPIKTSEEAWSKRDGVTPDIKGGREIWDIPMGRNVGVAGGQVGQQAYIPLQTVRIIVKKGTSEVVTAFPIP